MGRCNDATTKLSFYNTSIVVHHPLRQKPINQFHLHSYSAVNTSALHIPANLACPLSKPPTPIHPLTFLLLSNTAPSESVEHSAAADMQSQPGSTQILQHSATRTPRIAWPPRQHRASLCQNGHATRSQVGCVGTDLMTILDMLTRVLAAQICVHCSGTEGTVDTIGHSMLLFKVHEADCGSDAS